MKKTTLLALSLSIFALACAASAQDVSHTCPYGPPVVGDCPDPPSHGSSNNNNEPNNRTENNNNNDEPVCGALCQYHEAQARAARQAEEKAKTDWKAWKKIKKQFEKEIKEGTLDEAMVQEWVDFASQTGWPAGLYNAGWTALHIGNLDEAALNFRKVAANFDNDHWHGACNRPDPAVGDEDAKSLEFDCTESKKLLLEVEQRQAEANAKTYTGVKLKYEPATGSWNLTNTNSITVYVRFVQPDVFGETLAMAPGESRNVGNGAASYGIWVCKDGGTPTLDGTFATAPEYSDTEKQVVCKQ